jgi:hypothetical protein
MEGKEINLIYANNSINDLCSISIPNRSACIPNTVGRIPRIGSENRPTSMADGFVDHLVPLQPILGLQAEAEGTWTIGYLTGDGGLRGN